MEVEAGGQVQVELQVEVQVQGGVVGAKGVSEGEKKPD